MPLFRLPSALVTIGLLTSLGTLSLPLLSGTGITSSAQAQVDAPIEGVIVEPNQAGFRIVFPAEPSEQRPNQDLTLYILEQSDTTFGMGYQVFPPAVSQLTLAQVQEVLAEAGRVFTDGEQILTERHLSLSGYPGYELTFETTDGAAGIVQTYLVNQTMYILLVSTDVPDTLSAIAPVFLESFALVDVAEESDETAEPNATITPQDNPEERYRQGIQSYRAGNLDNALENFEAAVTGYRSQGDRANEAQALYSLGTVYNDLGRYAEAEAVYEQSLQMFRTLADVTGEAIVLNNLATNHDDQGAYVEAINGYQQSLALARQIDDPELIGGALNNLGHVFAKQGDWQAATEYYQQALTIARATTPQTERLQLLTAASLSNLAEISTERGQYPEALRLLEESLALAEEQGDRAQQAIVLNNLGGVYNGQGNYLQAQHHYQQALEIVKTLGLRREESIALGNLGTVSQSLGEIPQALTLLEESLALARELEDVAIESTTLNNLGGLYAYQSNYSQALEAYEAALAIADDLGNIAQRQVLLNNIGELYARWSRYDLAKATLEEALALARILESSRAETSALNNLGYLYERQGAYLTAADRYQQALEIRRKMDDRPGTATVLNNLGQLYRQQGEYHQALETLQQSLAIAEEIGAPALQADMLNNLAEVHRALGHYPEATSLIEQAIALHQALGNQVGEAISLELRGRISDAQGNFAAAIGHYEQAWAIAQTLQQPELQITLLNDWGNALDGLNQYAEALTYYQASLARSEEIGDVSAQAAALNNLGKTSLVQGNFPAALDSLENALALSENLGDSDSIAITLTNLGTLYGDLGQYDRARTFLEEALSIYRDNGNRAAEATTLNNLGHGYLQTDDYRQALTFFSIALDIHRQTGSRAQEAIALNNLALAYDYLEQTDQALASYETALTLAQDIGDRRTEASLLNNLGLLHNTLGQPETGLEYLQTALALDQATGNQIGQGIAHHNLGRVLLANGQVAAAIPELTAAVNLWELLRPGLKDQDQVSLFETQLATYRYLQMAQVQQGNPEAALVTAERGRTQALAELLSQRLQPPHDPDREMTSRTNPNLANLRQIAQAQNATLVEYSVVGPEDTPETLYTWVIQPDGTLHFTTTDLTEVALSELITESRQQLARGSRASIAVVSDTDVSLDDQLQQLHAVLIEPIQAWLPTDPEARVIFIPQGDLFSVPFPALQTRDLTYLIEQHTPLTAPSIQVLSLAQQRRQQLTQSATGSPLIVGNPEMPEISLETELTTEPISIPLPPLPGTEQEAREIAALLNVDPLLGATATEATVTAQMQTASMIHLATHGLLEYGQPQVSGVRDLPGALALTPDPETDGLLTASEILDIPLQAEMVVLSACDTGRGDITGDGVIGLARSLIAAGTPSVVVSLWAVPDAPTADLMIAFYQQLQTTSDKAQALRQAMLEVQTQHPDPTAWAGFTLIGEAQ
ncbi:MAG: tetratricopeptide repeat protein [Leptolyngbya sp. SIO1D8]|nr:tetratricopeptide repeat protein [Leptolyngbya sp. SIO1D8]